MNRLNTTGTPGNTTVAIEVCLNRLQQGDASAIDDLTSRSYERVRIIAHRQLRRYPGLVRFVETQDVLHDVLTRLNEKMETKQPGDAREYFRWTSKQIRDHLIDLLRHFYGRRSSNGEVPGRGRAGQLSSLDAAGEMGQQASSDTYDAAKIQEMAEFHEAVSNLPGETREVFDLLFYHGLTQEQAAGIMGVTDRTVRTRWQRARRQLVPYMPTDLVDDLV